MDGVRSVERVCTKERDSRLSRFFVTVGSSFLVWISGLEPKITVGCYFPRSRETDLLTKVPTRTLTRYTRTS